MNKTGRKAQSESSHDLGAVFMPFAPVVSQETRTTIVMAETEGQARGFSHLFISQSENVRSSSQVQHQPAQETKPGHMQV